mmetsp:Transcript_5116/g.8370  ORF Transcript_5116/g.8370 Transcript_5116/m.8370 type:complete len:304 (+) Transcript_5116:1594-2505(+)
MIITVKHFVNQQHFRTSFDLYFADVAMRHELRFDERLGRHENVGVTRFAQRLETRRQTDSVRDDGNGHVFALAHHANHHIARVHANADVERLAQRHRFNRHAARVCHGADGVRIDERRFHVKVLVVVAAAGTANQRACVTLLSQRVCKIAARTCAAANAAGRERDASSSVFAHRIAGHKRVGGARVVVVLRKVEQFAQRFGLVYGSAVVCRTRHVRERQAAVTRTPARANAGAVTRVDGVVANVDTVTLGSRSRMVLLVDAVGRYTRTTRALVVALMLLLWRLMTHWRFEGFRVARLRRAGSI